MQHSEEVHFPGPIAERALRQSQCYLEVLAFYKIPSMLTLFTSAPSTDLVSESCTRGDRVWPIWINNEEVQWYKISMWSWNEVLGLSQRRDCAAISIFFVGI
jgi:hypothetical protein